MCLVLLKGLPGQKGVMEAERWVRLRSECRCKKNESQLQYPIRFSRESVYWLSRRSQAYQSMPTTMSVKDRPVYPTSPV
jgi:hypothetical protein